MARDLLFIYILILCIHYGCGIPVNTSCPRFAGSQEMGHTGSGHQFGTTMMGFALSDQLNAVHVYNPNNKGGRSRNHGANGWTFDFFNLREGIMTDREAIEKYHPRIVIANQGWNRAVETYRNECNILVWISDMTCVGGVDGVDEACLHADRVRFDDMKWRIRAKFMRSTWIPKNPLLYRKSHLNVALHVRTGDIELHKDEPEFFRALYRYVDYATQDLDIHVHYYVFAECKICPPPGFEFLREILPTESTDYVSDMNPEDTMYHFVNANILIETGSSFPSMAKIASPKPVAFQTCAKGMTRFEIYHDAQDIVDAVQVSCRNYTLLNMAIDEMRAVVQYKFFQYRTWFWPPKPGRWQNRSAE
jgi:hypothetical protein